MDTKNFDLCRLPGTIGTGSLRRERRYRQYQFQLLTLGLVSVPRADAGRRVLELRNGIYSQRPSTLGLSLTTVCNCAARGMPTHSVSAAKDWRARCVRQRIKPLRERWSDGDHQADNAEGDAELIWDQCDIERLNEYGLGYLVRIALACEKKDFSQARAQFEILCRCCERISGLKNSSAILHWGVQITKIAEF